MVTQERITVTPKRFALKLTLALQVAGIKTHEEAAKAIAASGYKDGNLTGKTVWTWTTAKVKEISWSMIECVAKATGQKIEYFLGLEPLDESKSGFKRSPVALDWDGLPSLN